MFDPRKEVPSLDFCKRLKELRFPQSSGGWYWVEVRGNYRLCFNDVCKENGLNLFYDPYQLYIWRYLNDVIKAPTVGELGERLPDFIEELGDLKCIFYKDEIGIEYGKWVKCGDYEITACKYANTEANARAKMLIWLIENKYVSFEGEDKNK